MDAVAVIGGAADAGWLNAEPQALGVDSKLLAKADSVDVIKAAVGAWWTAAGFHEGVQLVAADWVVAWGSLAGVGAAVVKMASRSLSAE